MSTSSISGSGSGEKRLFTLQEARELAPLVRKITVNAVGQVNNLLSRLESLDEGDPEFEDTHAEINSTVRVWAEKLHKIGCEIKGLWLVDFDNGEGYYCWRFPEDEIDHFHSYEESFEFRRRIC